MKIQNISKIYYNYKNEGVQKVVKNIVSQLQNKFLNYGRVRYSARPKNTAYSLQENVEVAMACDSSQQRRKSFHLWKGIKTQIRFSSLRKSYLLEIGS